jgi:hydroxymethylpyrimidine pyrophosphatase-like HAD family hydrolase
VPASGRQHATLARSFAGETDGMVVIAENGSYVVRDGVELSSVTISLDGVVGLLHDLRALARGGAAVGAVVCGKRSAYVERGEPGFDAQFLPEVARYYARLEVVDDLTTVDDDVLKVAIWSPDDVASVVLPTLEPCRATHQVVVSGGHWVDVMSTEATKGAALQRLQAELGVGREETVVFGDYLNDLEMLDAADGSYAMAEAHPDVLARARFRAPSHRDHGVVTVLEQLLS